MRLGRLNTRVTVLRLDASARDSLNAPIKVWSTLGLFWGEEVTQRPMESWKAGQSAAQTETLFRLKRTARSATIGAKDRLLVKGRTFDVIGQTAKSQGDRIELIAIAATD